MKIIIIFKTAQILSLGLSINYVTLERGGSTILLRSVTDFECNFFFIYTNRKFSIKHGKILVYSIKCTARLFIKVYKSCKLWVLNVLIVLKSTHISSEYIRYIPILVLVFAKYMSISSICSFISFVEVLFMAQFYL